MKHMKDRTLRVLEFVKIREQLSTLAITPMGAQLCMELVSSKNYTEIVEWQ